MSPLLLGIALAVGAPNLKDKPAADPSLVGVWALESLAHGGHVRRHPDGLRWEFTPGGAYVRHLGEARPRFRYAVGPAADARRVDLDMGPDPAGPGSRVIRAVYKVDGDRLTMALPQDDQTARPADFRTPADDHVVVYVFRRLRPTD